MKKIVCGMFAIAAVACNQTNEPLGAVIDSSVLVINDTIAEVRPKPAKEPVVRYTESVSDDVNNANNWEFSAEIYETTKTFVYRIEMRYKELRETAEMQLPNFGSMPKPAIRKTGNHHECIIGFLDKKGVFKEYKKLSAKNDRLKLTTIAHYSVGVYRTKMK